jgi:hypothetical protein
MVWYGHHHRIGVLVLANNTNRDRLCLRLHDPISFRDPLADLFVLVLQKTERVGRVVPLALVRTPVKSCGELLGQVFSVFVLQSEC